MVSNLSHHRLISSGLLWRAIAISLLLHAVLLLQPGFDTVASSPASSQSLIALLQVRAEPQLKQPPVFPPTGHLHSEHTRHDTHKPTAPELVREVSSAAPAASMPQSAPEAVNSSAIVASSANSPTHNAVDASTTTAATSVGAGLDFAEGKKAYMFALAAEARRVKKYPALALAAGRTGEVVIHIEAAAGGAVQAPQLRQSSGFDDIDNAALSFVGIALKQTPLPDNLRGRAFAFDLPVSFTLKDN
jgi:protein TonB